VSAPAKARSGAARRAALALLVAAAAALGACATGGAREDAAGRSSVPRTTARVVNRSFAAHTVYVVTDTERRRLGTVQATASAVFTIPAGFVRGITTLSFQADPIGSDATASSFRVSVAPGQQVELTIY
jgi:hypothetical protein